MYLCMYGASALLRHIPKGGRELGRGPIVSVHSVHPPGERGEGFHSPGGWARFVGELVDRGIVASCLGKERGLRADDYR